MKSTRQTKIRQLEDGGQISVTELNQILDVSKATTRCDVIWKNWYNGLACGGRVSLNDFDQVLAETFTKEVS